MDRPSRPIDLTTLSPKEWLLLSARAEKLCVQRLTTLASRLASSDEALSEALAGMAEDESAHLAELSEFDANVAWPALIKVDERALALLLASHMPTLCRGLDSDDTNAVKAFVRDVEQESIGFYRLLAARAATPELAAFFERMAQAEEAHAHHADKRD